MTRVCLLGKSELSLQYELLSRETSREALSAYEIERPYENTLAIRTISIGAAVSLLNDLQWYLTRFAEAAFVQEPSVDDSEWLSRELATLLRNGDLEPAETGEFCLIYGIEPIGRETAVEADSDDAGGDRFEAKYLDEERGAEEDRYDDPEGAGEAGDSDDRDVDDAGGSSAAFAEPTRKLVEPLYARRIDGDVPNYDLRDVEETLVVRLTREEFVE